jgi:hypothetical protein
MSKKGMLPSGNAGSRLTPAGECIAAALALPGLARSYEASLLERLDAANKDIESQEECWLRPLREKARALDEELKRVRAVLMPLQTLEGARENDGR